MARTIVGCSNTAGSASGSIFSAFRRKQAGGNGSTLRFATLSGPWMTRHNLTAPATRTPSTRSSICRGRKFTSSIRTWRIANRRGWFRSRTWMVTRPSGVSPASLAPSPPEMLGPDVGPGVKEADDFPGGRIDSRNIWPLAKVAFEATPARGCRMWFVHRVVSQWHDRSGTVHADGIAARGNTRKAPRHAVPRDDEATWPSLQHTGGVCSLASTTFGPWIEEKREGSRR